MKFLFFKIVFVIFLLIPLCLLSQSKNTPTNYNHINQDKGTIVIKEIKRDNSIAKDSSVITIRLYGLNCQTIKGGPNAAKSIIIDGMNYGLDSEGILQLVITKGIHLLDLEYPGDTLFSPLKATTLKFKKRHTYTLEVYFSMPTKGYHSL